MIRSYKNRYIKNARISEEKFRKILRCFALDLTAQATSELVGISRNSTQLLFSKIRAKILIWSTMNKKVTGNIELDESYFGARRVRGKRGRGASGKIPVFGLLKRDGCVYVEIIENCSKRQLMPIIKNKIQKGSTIYTDGWRAYDGLIFNGYEHYRIHHHDNEFARGHNHVNGIESFWSFAKRRLAKFNGITRRNFFIHLKETEFRFNCRNAPLYAILLKNFRKEPL